jgi:hypothetical protein
VTELKPPAKSRSTHRRSKVQDNTTHKPRKSNIHDKKKTEVDYYKTQADRGCATVAFFLGGEGGVWSKKGVTLRGLRISEKKEILRKPTVL